jgi:hypothetical protein
MYTTTTAGQKHSDRDETADCDSDWCDGPDGESLPCFACSDPDRTYTEPDT